MQQDQLLILPTPDEEDLLKTIIEEAANLNQSYKNIRDDRNTYDILSVRSKYYGS